LDPRARAGDQQDTVGARPRRPVPTRRLTSAHPPTLSTVRPLVAIALTAVSLATTRVAHAQFTTYTDRADLKARGTYSENSLTLPNGSTSIALPPIFVSSRLSGATVQNGQISSSTPFDFVFDTFRVASSFGADFFLAGGGTLTLSFFTNIAAGETQQLVGSVDFALGGTSPQFFGVISNAGFQRVHISASAGTLVVDNIATTVPEPGAWALLGTGLVAVGSVVSVVSVAAPARAQIAWVTDYALACNTYFCAAFRTTGYQGFSSTVTPYAYATQFYTTPAFDALGAPGYYWSADAFFSERTDCVDPSKLPSQTTCLDTETFTSSFGSLYGGTSYPVGAVQWSWSPFGSANSNVTASYEMKRVTFHAHGSDGIIFLDVPVPLGAATTSVMPEPSTWALLGTGLVALAAVRHRRRRRW
jgi:hypothetical protein